MASKPVTIKDYISPIETARNLSSHEIKNDKNKFKFKIFKTDKQRVSEYLEKQEDKLEDYWQIQTNQYSISPADINNLYTMRPKFSPKKKMMTRQVKKNCWTGLATPFQLFYNQT